MRPEFKTIGLILGVDVQVKRACPYYALDSNLDCLASGWLEGSTRQEIAQNLLGLVEDLEAHTGSAAAVGIDAPRMALQQPREYYWKGDSWRERTSQDRGYGRHCEVIIKALGIANPQWTRLRADAPPWMRLGFEFFKSLDGRADIFEVFPSASYALLEGSLHEAVSLSFQRFRPGPKDMLDACLCAFTVWEFIRGRGCEVGGGDQLGTIILPGKLPVPSTHPVLTWPIPEDQTIF